MLEQELFQIPEFEGFRNIYIYIMRCIYVMIYLIIFT